MCGQAVCSARLLNYIMKSELVSVSLGGFRLAHLARFDLMQNVHRPVAMLDHVESWIMLNHVESC